jgi:hypothetical protein
MAQISYLTLLPPAIGWRSSSAASLSATNLAINSVSLNFRCLSVVPSPLILRPAIYDLKFENEMKTEN